MIIYEYTDEEKEEIRALEYGFIERSKKLEINNPERDNVAVYDDQIANVYKEYSEKRNQLEQRCAERQFNALGQDLENIREDAIKQTNLMLERRFEVAITNKNRGIDLSDLRLDDNDRLIDIDSLILDSDLLLSMHYDFFKGDPAAVQDLKAKVLKTIKNSPYTANKKTHRIRTREEKTEAIADIPKGLANITAKNYQYGMSWHEEGKAYLQQLYTTDGLKFKDGKLYFDDTRMRQVSEVELQNMKTKEGIESIDLTFLRAIYSIILQRFINNKYKPSKEVLSFNISDIAEYTGGRSNLNKYETEALIKKFQSYHNIIGVLHHTQNEPGVPSRYPVLNFEGYNNKTKKISFNSPYMNYVIETVYNASIVKNAKGIVQKDKKGNLLTTAAYSWIEKGSLAKARNKTAVENVAIIVRLIEQCGDNEPHIKVSTLIDRNELFSQQMASDTNTTRLLKRVFTNTWEYLIKYTDLANRYKNIQLPDPKDPKNIPSTKDLDKVFTFSHDGKISPK